MAKMPAAMMKKFGAKTEKKEDKVGAKKAAGKKPGKALPFFMKGKK